MNAMRLRKPCDVFRPRLDLSFEESLERAEFFSDLSWALPYKLPVLVKVSKAIVLQSAVTQAVIYAPACYVGMSSHMSLFRHFAKKGLATIDVVYTVKSRKKRVRVW